MSQVSQSNCQCFDPLVFRFYGQGTLLGTRLPVIMEIIALRCWKFVFIGGRFTLRTSPDKGIVQEFLDNLQVKQEELASVGVDINEKDYWSTIISSLPYSLANFASSQLAAAWMFTISKTIAPDSLISLISEEYKCQESQKSHCSEKTKDNGDEAMVASSSSGKGKEKLWYPWGVLELWQKRTL